MTEVKTVTAPSGQTFKLGRNKPLVPAPKLHFGNYTLRRLPPPPDAVDYSVMPQRFLADVLGNDRNGCCTCSAAFHIAGALVSNTNVPVPIDLNTQNTLKMYYHLTGGQDTGLTEQLVFDWWRVNGLVNGAHKITTKVAVNAADQEEVKTALFLFENLYLTAELPDAWINPFPSGDGFTWDVAGDPDPENGHAICAFSYGQGAIQKVDSWGLLGNIPFDALATYMVPKNGGGLYSVLSPEIISRATSRAPTGFDFSQLLADITSFQP